MDPLPWYRMLLPLAIVRPSIRAHATLLGVGLFILYGMIQDQLSVRLAPEYFTVLHNPIPGLTDPTLLGMAWGFLGSAGGGVAVGYAAGLAATLGKNPPLPVRKLIRPMLALLLGVAVVSAITGYSAHRHLELFQVQFPPSVEASIPPERCRATFVVGCYHFASYATAVLGSVVLCMFIGSARGRMAKPELN
jgi:hypothetical protein